MIKQINITSLENLDIQLMKALDEGYTHFVPYSNDIMLHQKMLDAVELKSTSIIVDYTIDKTYLNDCRYFGLETVDFIDWVKNINHFPNVIYEIKSALVHLEKFNIETIFDLALVTILKGQLAVDGHVVFDFKTPIYTSSQLWSSIDKNNISKINQFYLNKIAYEHRQKIPFPRFTYNDHSELRYSDSVLLSTKFRLPKWMFKPFKNLSLKKHRELSYIYDKDKSLLKEHVVFMGFDYGYRGNSKYLFNYFVKRNPTINTYFVTNDRQGPHFISPEDSETKSMIETAKVVVTESYIPDDIKPNGTIIQLWHGTPIKKLFLDSHEPNQNLNIYNYRARKYNKLAKQDYLVCDSKFAMDMFHTAFPTHDTEVLPIGYPRVQYLLNKLSESSFYEQLKRDLNCDLIKPILLYAPTWLSNNELDPTLPITDQLLDKYNVIFKGHVESSQTVNLPDEVIIPQKGIETQDLLLISDIVLTDYSSIVFDALTIDKRVCLYTPYHDQYKEERGIYNRVMKSLANVWYTDPDLLLNDLVTDMIPKNDNPYINKNNQSLQYLTKLIQKELK
ncbi:CDP-glycerol glycerophosphotransferase family protein [Staphylococcus pasteuri]|uniref:CDP-glycerol glycerophosphotransferase family protein n=1 Tax=Staphylococcus pasteuri TaxID=45972 RepID=UPI000E3976A0|nr:CDP-glycerol glycerophosphotransferase family protein [Staphylococcus pasteuri]RFD74140.1 teichoic acid biosynthesis protein F [Staphylococcus pasteuri]